MIRIALATMLFLAGGVVAIYFGAAGPARSLPTQDKERTDEGQALHFDEEIIDLGVVEGTASGSARFRNQMRSPVTIETVSASCSCTSTRMPKQVFGPGEVGYVPFEVDVRQKSPGVHRFTITMTVRDGSSTSAQRFYILARNQPDRELRPKSPFLFLDGEVDGNVQVELVDRRDSPRRIASINADVPWLSAKASEVRPSSDGALQVLSLSARSSDAPYGVSTCHLTLGSDDPSDTPLVVPITVHRPHRVAAPTAITLQRSEQGFSGTCELWDRRGSKVVVASVESPFPETTWSCTEGSGQRPTTRLEIHVPECEEGTPPWQVTLMLESPSREDIQVWLLPRIGTSAHSQ